MIILKEIKTVYPVPNVFETGQYCVFTNVRRNQTLSIENGI